jgi:hypothetical protein
MAVVLALELLIGSVGVLLSANIELTIVAGYEGLSATTAVLV